MKHYCVQCSKPQGDAYKPFCECGGMVEIEYDIHQVKLRDSTNPYERFIDLLPISTKKENLPKNTVFTPMVHAKGLGKFLGMKSLYLKDETVLPTKSTKDRMAEISLAYLWERGVRSFCTSSTGNSSSAYAHSIQNYPDMKLFLFTAENFAKRVQYADHAQVKHFGMRGASFVGAFEYAAVYAKKHNLVSERGFFNIGRREGLKLAYLEACDQIPQGIDWYVQGVSSAMGVYGTYKGAKEMLALKKIKSLPRLLCVQQESCSPMVNAYQEDAEEIKSHHIIPNPKGIAEAILRGDPTRAYPHVRRIVKESRGQFIAVSENEIREAKKMVEELEGISPCFSASATVAGVIKGVREGSFPKDDTVMINLTGGDRIHNHNLDNVTWLKQENNDWIEESV